MYCELPPIKPRGTKNAVGERRDHDGTRHRCPPAERLPSDAVSGRIGVAKRRLNQKRMSQAEAWQELARRIGGDVVRDKRGRPIGVRLRFRYWTVVFDLHTVSTGHSQHTSTRARALFGAMDDFRFRIYRKTFFTRLAERFGLRGMPTGHVMLDRDYRLISNSEPKARSLFLRTRVADGIARQPSGQLEIRPLGRGERTKQPAGTRQLVYQVSGSVADADRLADIAALFEETLDQLYRMGLVTDREVRPAD